MRTITLKQPWAGLLVRNIKHHETRSWPIPRHLINSPIAIHAGKEYDRSAMDPARGILKHLTRHSLLEHNAIRSAIIGEVDFRACHQVDKYGGFPVFVNVLHLPFGNYDPGMYFWVVGRNQVYPNPILGVKGKLGIWTYEGGYPL